MKQSPTLSQTGSSPAGGGGRTAPCLLDRTVAAVVFDWDGTAVPDRKASARRVRTRIEKLSSLGVHAAVVTGTDLRNIDGQLRARPPGPGRLLLGLNRGSELFEVAASGPILIERRHETPATARDLDHVAAALAARLRAAGLPVEVVGSRLNRRKIDLIPEPDWADPPKARIAELVAAVTNRLERAGFASIAEVADLAVAQARAGGLSGARVTSDAKHIEIGVTDTSDSLRAILERLDRLGVAGELVLVVGDEFGDLAGLPGSDALLVPEHPQSIVVSVGVEPCGVPDRVRHLGGGPPTFVALLDEQLRRAERLRVPEVCRDPRWNIVERGVDPARHRVTESLFTVSSGGVGFRGSVEESPEFGQPLVVAAGVYSGPAAADGLLPGPDVVDVTLDPPVREDVRVLDLRTGTLHRAEVDAGGAAARSMRFASTTQPGVLALRVEAATRRLHVPVGPGGGGGWTTVGTSDAGVGALAEQGSRRDDGVMAVQRLVAVDGSPTGPASLRRTRRRLARASAAGFERLLAEQRSSWAARWQRVDVTIPDDPETELGLRFALFHLWSLSGSGRELAVGARGLTGNGYAGHVFWDADVFVLPALVTIDPAAAGAMVDYRLNRLSAARRRARADGRRGARFPWESARNGRDVTPAEGYVGGERIHILTGDLEEHITADVAWAVVHHATWTRPTGCLTKAEALLLRDTARYWASRIATDADGSAHVRGVIGPDEYHERVDDNAFTNAMARWNLRAAAHHAPVAAAERAAWTGLSEVLVDGYDAGTGLYEQFRGYFGLRPLLIRDLAEPPVAADVLAGRDAIAGSQVLKQPDVLMIHHLLPGEAAPGSLAPNLDFYAPRTAHGSSLSPAAMAVLHARAGQPDVALELLRLSLRIDLDDLGQTTSAGVHLGACGGAWQAVVRGFLGAEVSGGRLRLDPVLPTLWSELEVRFRCLGRDVRVRVEHDRLVVDASAPLTVELTHTRYQPSTSSDVDFVPGGSP